MENPLVSICSTTYNLEKYISIALDSWLSQKVNFSFEIVISDDCSKDGTTAIIQQYIEKYPGVIKLHIGEKNLGMLPNFIRSLQLAKGKYIAVCDGDDYWINNNKLQMQIEFLENNPDYSSCFTNSLVLDETTGNTKIAKKDTWDTANSEQLLFHDDFRNDNIPLSPGHISSYVFRNNLLEYPEWFYKIDGVTDFPLYMMISKFGLSKFFNIETSVYRKHDKSNSNNDYEFVRLNQGRINIYKCVNLFFEGKYKSIIYPLIGKHYFRLLKYFFKRKAILKTLNSFINLLYYDGTLTFRVAKSKFI